jgi:DNA invertase Pin-like site-specific DNA recombinase
MTALGYIRRSESTASTLEKRGTEVLSLEIQETAIRAECDRQGWTLAGVIVEDGVSGGRRDRLTRLSTALRSHQASVLVVYHSDRLARDLAGLLDAVRAWNKRGVTVYVVSRGYLDLASSSGFLSAGVEGLVAEHWRLICSEKTRAAMARLRHDGRRWAREAPYGWCWEAGRVVPCPQEQATLTLLGHLAPGRTLRALGAALHAAGHAPRSGGTWAPQVLSRLVRRSLATDLTPHEGSRA